MANISLLVVVLLSVAAIISAVLVGDKDVTLDEAMIMPDSAEPISATRMFDLLQDENTVLVDLDTLYDIEDYNDLVQERTSLNGEGLATSKREVHEDFLWENATLPIEVAPEFSYEEQSTIISAVKDFIKNTCLRVRFGGTDKLKSKVRIQRGEQCSSAVGPIGGTQIINIKSSCATKGGIIHLLGHACGLVHEHNRLDRDEHIKIQFFNIGKREKYKYQKDPATKPRTFDIPYDYLSIMHFGPLKGKFGLRRIVTKDKKYQKLIGKADYLSYRDIQRLSAMYKCAEKHNCPPKTCPQGFYGKECKCWCFSGDRFNPLKECDGKSMTENLNACIDRTKRCQKWAKNGRCSKGIVKKKCPYTCNSCEETAADDPQTTPASGCFDVNEHCEFWADHGECAKSPYFMLESCKQSCGVCNNETQVCRDARPKCIKYRGYCNLDNFKDYLSANCKRTCGLCTEPLAQDELSTQAPKPKKSMGKCVNRWTDERCYEKQQKGMCTWNTAVTYNCEKSCFLC